MAQRDKPPQGEPDQPLTPPGVEPAAEPEVIADAGQFLLRVTDPFITEYHGHYPADGKTPEAPVTITRAGVQVTKAMGSYLQLQAAEHGVATSLEKVSDDGGR